MPFSEISSYPEASPPNRPDGKLPEGTAISERKEEDNPRDKAVAFLIRTGRANTPEEAERYLESLNRLKEKLILFAKEQVLDEKTAAAREHSMQAYYPMIRRGRSDVTQSDLETLSAEDIDQNDPTLWVLGARVEPQYSSLPKSTSGYVSQEQLSVSFRTGAPLSILPDNFGWGESGRRLRKQLAEDEMEFLKNEYTFALKDLEKQLRDLIHQIKAQNGFSHPGWKTLSPATAEQVGEAKLETYGEQFERNSEKEAAEPRVSAGEIKSPFEISGHRDQ